MKTLSTEHRRQLERAVVDARNIAEAGARAALEALAVNARDPFGHMTEQQKAVRRRLRAHARHLGDTVDARSGMHRIDHLTHECAYEQWHAMLFARFLAENHLLIEPELAVPVTLDECEELAKGEGTDRWTLASRFAQRMLPQVFRPDHPVFGLRLAREYRARLEEIVEGLAPEIFTANDALGWVYQFWQARKKDEVNRSEAKIGADELPAVTQLFTEPYMVQFLLHNSLGAWWASRHPDRRCPADLSYLRLTEDGVPAAGTFDTWPDDLSEFRLLDPCCGSGHFLVAALLMLVPMRMVLEHVDASTAVNAVLRENLHGLEIDQRCVAIAAFALALEAWRYPGAGGHRPLPRLNVAWCGQPVVGGEERWVTLANGDDKLESGMAALYKAFRAAPTLGSLVDPQHSAPEADLVTAGFAQLKALMDVALKAHDEQDEPLGDLGETAIAAFGLMDTARILGLRYHQVVTNPPFLALERQGRVLAEFVKRRFPAARRELALCFLERALGLLDKGGLCSLVLPGEWTFKRSNRRFRATLLGRAHVRFIARLGVGSFGSGVRANPILFMASDRSEEHREPVVSTLDVSDSPLEQKGASLRNILVTRIAQKRWSSIPDHRLLLDTSWIGADDYEGLVSIGSFCDCRNGLSAGDGERFVATFWEVTRLGDIWELLQSSTGSDISTREFGGREKNCPMGARARPDG